ncbi:ribosomal protein L24 [gamma proteobacterium HTCC5015]|nr:ribosomal protein L24 [gamma proteobacterium HTCC5015]
MRKIQTGDQVIVIAGKDKGRQGKVISVNTALDKVTVENVNMVKKHVRPNPQVGEPGGIVEKEMPLDVSNVAIYNAKTEKADRVGVRVEDGKKVRYYKSSGDAVA